VTSRVGLITIWFRTGAEIDRFVRELHAQTFHNLLPTFVVHSLMATEIERLRVAAPEALILEPGDNLGPAAGWNLAIGRLLEKGPDFIGICNVDTHLDPSCIDRLLEVLEASPEIGACQPILRGFDQPERVQMFGGSLDVSTGLATHDYKGARYTAALPPVHDADYLDGGSMLVRADVFRQVGRFDERLFMYAEDCDLSLRIRRAGYRTVAVRDALAWHEHAEGRGHLPPRHEVFYRTRNRFFLVRKYASQQAWRRAATRAITLDLPLGTLFYVRRRRPDLAKAHVAGVVAGVIGRFGRSGWVD
jgi:GT2 family glycosyltransferase